MLVKAKFDRAHDVVELKAGFEILEHAWKRSKDQFLHLSTNFLKRFKYRWIVENSTFDQSFNLIFRIHGMPDVVFVRQPSQNHLQPILLHNFDYFQWKVVRVIEKLYWASLKENCFELFNVLWVSHHDHVDSNLQQRVRNKVIVLWDSNQVIGEILILVLKRNHSPFCQNLSHTSLQSFLCLFSLASLLAHPFLHLLRSFQLFNNHQLVSQLHEFMRILIEALLRETDMHLTAHPLQIQTSVSHSSVLIEHFVEFAQFE